MKVYVNDKLILLLFDTEKESSLVNTRFTIPDKSSVFVGGSYDVSKIRYRSFLGKKKPYSYLFSGYLKELIVLIKTKGINVTEFSDKRTKYKFQKKYTNDELKAYLPNFDYIEHQVSALRTLTRTNIGIIDIITGGGKTEIFIAFLKLSKLPALILVNKITLCEQIFNRLKESGLEDIGICNSKKFIDGSTVVSTIGSVKRLNLHKFECLIGDEIHNFSSKTFQDFLKKTSYPIRFGFSGTPNKGDEFKWNLIKQYFGNVLYKIGSEPLIKNKVVAKPNIYFINNYCKNTKDWFSSYTDFIINNKDRNEKIIKIASELKLPTLILIKDIKNKQGEFILNGIEKNGKRVAFIHGNTNDRNKYIDMLENNELDVLISTNILNEGISIKNVFLLIMASGEKSFSSTAQKIGRSLRTKDGKIKSIVVDFTDSDNNFLEKHSKIRMKIYQRLGFCNIVKLDLEAFLDETRDFFRKDAL